jgi:molybdopterin-guanine dinucleotide biosynthesis protein A
MGRDKTALVSHGTTLVERAAQKLAAIGLQVVIADRGHARLPGWISVSDGPGAGPGAAILGAALAYPERSLLVLACDLPCIPQELLAALAWTRGWDWTVPRWDRGLEPLCALYRPAALQALSEMIGERGGPAPVRLAETDGLRVGFLDPPWISRFGPPTDVFLNVNTPADLARFKQIEGETEPPPKKSKR